MKKPPREATRKGQPEHLYSIPLHPICQMEVSMVNEYQEKIIKYVRQITSPKELAFLLEIVADVYQTEGMLTAQKEE